MAPIAQDKVANGKGVDRERVILSILVTFLVTVIKYLTKAFKDRKVYLGLVQGNTLQHVGNAWQYEHEAMITSAFSNLKKDKCCSSVGFLLFTQS